jgi:hypothetical protein
LGCRYRHVENSEPPWIMLQLKMDKILRFRILVWRKDASLDIQCKIVFASGCPQVRPSSNAALIEACTPRAVGEWRMPTQNSWGTCQVEQNDDISDFKIIKTKQAAALGPLLLTPLPIQTCFCYIHYVIWNNRRALLLLGQAVGVICFYG